MEPALPSFRPRSEGAPPLHRQVEAWLREVARLPDYAGGRSLPDEVTLARDLGISRHTLRLALARLEREGLLERSKRVGTRVARNPPEHHLDRWLSFRAEMAQQGVRVEDFAREARWLPADGPVAAALDVAAGTPVLRLRRVRGWEGRPQVVADSWLHPRLGLTGTEDFSEPLYGLLARAGSERPARSREEIAAGRGDGELRGLLALARGIPVLIRRRTVLDAQGRPIEYNVNWYRGDRYALRLELGP